MTTEVDEKEILNSLEEYLKAEKEDELVAEQVEMVLNFTDKVKAMALVNLFRNPDFSFQTQTLSTLQTASQLLPRFMKSYLLNECPTCWSFFPKDYIYSFNCGCSLCYGCFDEWFKPKVSKTYDMNLFYCPGIDPEKIKDKKEPQFHRWSTEEERDEHFMILNLFIQHSKTLDESLKFLFYHKLAAFSASKIGRYVSCRQGCQTAILLQKDTNPIQCPNCPKKICIHCHLQWTNAHRNKSCEQFQIESDPVMEHVYKDNGIFCPNCKRMSWHSGGCKHFDCPFCSFSFCTGCRAKFYTKENKCQRRDHQEHDLHAHHPRNCAYFLDNGQNDCEIMKELKKLLDFYKIPLDPEKASNKEYLLKLIVIHKVDTIDLMNIEQLQFLLQNNPIKKVLVPKNPYYIWSEQRYAQLLRDTILREFPLKNWFIS